MKIGKFFFTTSRKFSCVNLFYNSLTMFYCKSIKFFQVKNETLFFKNNFYNHNNFIIIFFKSSLAMV